MPPCSDEKAIQGTWEVVSSTFGLLRKLPLEKKLTSDEVLKTTKVVITADTLKIVGKGVTALAFEYRLNPAATTKMIDLQTGGENFGLVSYGIYQLEEGQLKICASPLRSLGDEQNRPDAKVLRPSELWAELGSGKEMLVLRRVGDAAITEDEKTIQGTWRVVEDRGAGGLPFGSSQRTVFSRQEVCVRAKGLSGPKPAAEFDVRFGYALDPTTQPKRIDLATVVCPPVEPLHGIYELQGDRLTIAWAISQKGEVSGYPGGLPPSTFAPGPNTGVVVLQRVKAVSGGEATSAERVPESAEARARMAKLKELSEIIRRMAGIETASVLVNGESRLGSANEKTTTVTVTVKTAPAAPLDEAKVASIRNLITGAMAGVKTEDVVVVDQGSGRVYRLGAVGGTGGVAHPERSDARSKSRGDPAKPLPPQGAPATELKVLQGVWSVRSVEKGRDADASWAAINQYGSPLDPATADRLVFGEPSEEYVTVRHFQPQSLPWFSVTSFEYRIDPSATPKTIDLVWTLLKRPSRPETPQPIAVGIYELDGDRLKIRLTRFRPALRENIQRPKSLALEPGSGDIVFVLERYRPSEDVKAMRGPWTVVAQTEDGKPLSADRLQGRSCTFVDPAVEIREKTADGKLHDVLHGRFTLDTATQPKKITIVTYYDYDNESAGRRELAGIYRFDGDALSIAYRQGGPPPEKFESIPRSGITLMVLRKAATPAADGVSGPTRVGWHALRLCEGRGGGATDPFMASPPYR